MTAKAKLIIHNSSDKWYVQSQHRQHIYWLPGSQTFRKCEPKWALNPEKV